LSVIKLNTYYESKTKRHRPQMLSGSQNKLNAKAKTDRSSKKKGVLDNYFNH